MDKRSLLKPILSRRSKLEAAAMTRLGLTGTMAHDARREAVWWAFARREALKTRRPLLGGLAIGWIRSGYAELLPFEVPRAGRGRVTVEVAVSAVSPGTERARYLRLPNAAPGLGIPGYSAAGTVIAVGPGVESVREGDLVALGGHGTRHASLATVPEVAAYGVPAGVPIESAALVRLGIICGQGVTQAGLRDGEDFVVIGAGPIGLLAQRLAVGRGAVCAAVIARSRAKERFAGAGGTKAFLVSPDDAEAIENLAAPVVIEATGDPEAVNLATAAVAEGGRVVLLGSSRGVTADLPVTAIRRKRLRLIGAHERTLQLEDPTLGAERREGEAFMTALAGGDLEVGDLAGEGIDPREAGVFYRELVSNREIVGAHFDWTRVPADDRVRPARLLRLPDVRGRGMDFKRRPLAPPTSASAPGALLDLSDPFVGATGRLGLGLLGCGDIAPQNAAAAAAAPNVELVAAHDPVEQLARGIADQYGADVTRSAEALIEHPGVDAVLISVPHHLHAPLGLQVLRAGKHAIVEKPLANSLAAAVELADEADRSSGMLTVCFPHRFESRVVLARRLIEAGALGEISGSYVHYFVDKAPGYWIGGFTGRSPSNWRVSKEKAGGGVLIMNMSHFVDLLRHLSGLEIEEVRALGDAGGASGEIEGTMSVMLTYENGGQGSVLSASSVRGTESTELRLWGRDGHVEVEPECRIWTLRPAAGLRPGRWQQLGLSGGRPHLARAVFLSRFATAIDQGLAPDVSVEDGLATQALMEASYLSSERGEPVRPAALLEGLRP